MSLATKRAGFFWALSAYVFWGFTPVFWKFLVGVKPVELMAHRVIFSSLCLTPFVLFGKNRIEVFKLLKQPRYLGLLALSSLLIVSNWYHYVFAMVTDQVLQSSLGYFLTPLASVFLGVVLLRERLNGLQLVSCVLAGTAVGLMVVRIGEAPWLAIILAVSFALYGYLKKITPVEGLVTVWAETVLASPFMLWLLYQGGSGEGGGGTYSVSTWVWIALTGPVTAFPLVWYTWGAHRITLMTLGFLQYMSPILQFVLAVYVYGEPFESTHKIAFCLIWIALSLFTYDLVRKWKYSPSL